MRPEARPIQFTNGHAHFNGKKNLDRNKNAINENVNEIIAVAVIVSLQRLLEAPVPIEA